MQKLPMLFTETAEISVLVTIQITRCRFDERTERTGRTLRAKNVNGYGVFRGSLESIAQDIP